MPDDKTNRGPQDRARINIHEPYEVRYWTKALGVTPEQLRQLVQQHGVSADAVRQAIGRNKK
jgi:hypothetical protein